MSCLDKVAFLIPQEEIEPGAMTQICDVAKMDECERMAIMPDCHQGYTMPIGGVALMRGAVSASFVGYDIGCVDNHTEYLTHDGWKHVDKYSGEDILVSDECGNAHFEKPIRYIDLPEENFYHIKTKYGVDQMLSPEHRMLLFKSNGTSYVDTASNIAKKHNSLVLGVRDKIRAGFNMSDSTVEDFDISDAQLRVMVMVCADGCFPRNTFACKLNFKKERKTERAKYLLQEANIKYTISPKYGVISFAAPIKTKTLTYFWKCSPRQLAIIAEEVLNWDGNKKDGVFFTRLQKDADFVQYAMTTSGLRATLTTDVRKGGIDYRVVSSKNIFVGFAGSPKSSFVKTNVIDSRKYCFTTSTGYWIMRRNGNIAVTGNCGMILADTGIQVDDMFPDENSKIALYDAVRAAIPNGVGQERSEFVSACEFKSALGEKELDKMVNAKLNAQFGTLGSGNHFCEFGRRLSTNTVCITIHSGSRKPGYIVGEWYMKKYPLLMSLDYSEMGNAYLQDMNYMLDYALNNRMQMLNDIFEILGTRKSTLFINENHNHAELMDNGMVLHRKGATPAEKGVMGVIPGSMHSGVYVTSGLGNDDYLSSASHGAGRKLGRNQAKRTLDVEAFKLQMKGIVACADESTLDEAPDAYKDLDYVMSLQTGIVVDVIDKVIPLINIKGA